MTKSAASPADWALIKARYQQGETTHIISKDYTMSRQAIDQKCEREGWAVERSSRGWLDLIKAKSKAKQSFGKMTPTNQAVILDLIRFGMSPWAAGQMCGLSTNAVKSWRDKDEDFNMLCISAARDFHLEKLAVINRTNDWQAASKALQMNWATKEEYAEKKETHSGVIKVELSFNRGADFKQPDIIEVEIEEVEQKRLT